VRVSKLFVNIVFIQVILFKQFHQIFTESCVDYSRFNVHYVKLNFSRSRDCRVLSFEKIQWMFTDQFQTSCFGDCQSNWTVFYVYDFSRRKDPRYNRNSLNE